MKKVLLLIVLSMLAGCSSAPPRMLMQDCKLLGNGIYDCQELPKGDIRGGARKGL